MMKNLGRSPTACSFLCPRVRAGHLLGEAGAWNKCLAIKSLLSSSQFHVPFRKLWVLQLSAQ